MNYIYNLRVLGHNFQRKGVLVNKEGCHWAVSVGKKKVRQEGLRLGILNLALDI